MKEPVRFGAVKLDRTHRVQTAVAEVSGKEIAIIGLSAKLPGNAGPDQFWHTLREGDECVGPLPAGRRRDIEAYLNLTGSPSQGLRYMDCAYLSDIDKFDYGFFRISPKEASLMAPAQRLFLETAWGAFEDAGYPPGKLSGSRTGIYLGMVNEPDSYKYREMVRSVAPSDVPIALSGNLVSITPSRIAYHLNLRGPSMVVDTACSSSLVALHLACQALRNGECDMALAGGVRVILFPIHQDDEKIGIESSDDRTKAFDDNADGSGTGEGVVALVLKPLHKALRDGDHVHAVIRGSAMNQDGSSIGITAPNPQAQAEVLAAAWRDAGVDPETISYIETHGTGTRLGDPIEVEGLNTAFRRFTDKRQFCAIGSVKTNVGHLYACAGLAGVVKAVQALRHREIPPHLNFGKPNGQISFGDSAVYVNARLAPWESEQHPRRCGVSAFGLSGTNCHVVLEEAPAAGLQPRPPLAEPNVLVLSARSEGALQRLVAQYQAALENDRSLPVREVCFTASTGREHHPLRLAVVAGDMADLQEKLGALQGQDFRRVQAPWFHYGEHTTSGSAHRSGALAHADKDRLSADAQEWVRRYATAGKADADSLREICRHYALGADIEWEELYRGENLRRVSLPGYPFDRHRCWIDLPGLEEEAPARREGGEASRPALQMEPPTREALRKARFYEVTWRQHELARTTAGAASGRLLVLAQHAGDATELAQTLRQHGRPVVVAALSGAEEAGCLPLSGTEADYVRLLTSLKAGGISRIVHLLSWQDQASVASVAELEERLERGVLSLYRLVRAIGQVGLTQDLQITLVTSRVYPVTEDEHPTAPWHAAMSGLAGVVPKEMPQVRCHSLDIDDATAIAAIVDELDWGPGSGKVAYRAGLRYVEEFGLADLVQHPAQAVTIREEGAYLITGGLGGMGLEMARYLAGRAPRVKLGLVGRSALPPREEWDSVRDRGSKAARAIAVVRELEERGAEVTVLQADVSDYAQLETAVGRLRQQHGRINGVIHAAGVGAPASLTTRPETEFRAVCAPKIAGTLAVDHLTRQDRPDFFVLCSSVASIFPAATQGDYAAANAFLDAYAAFRSAMGLPTLAINWTTWKETGMAADQGFIMDTMFKALPTQSAMAAFSEALGRSAERLLIGELNVDGGGARLLLASRVRLSEHLAAALQQMVPVKQEQTATAAAGRKVSGAVQLTGREHEQYSATERLLAEICRETLGYSQLDVNENFFELGADSILLSRIRSRIDERYPGLVQVTDLFQYATIAKLAQFIVAKTNGEEPGDTPHPRADVHATSGEIAIIGMAARLPRADTLDEFWENVNGGVDSVVRFPEARRQEMDRYMRFKQVPAGEIDYLEGAYLEEIDKFDCHFFRIPPREAMFIDPHQRLFLEASWHAMEDAGYGGGGLAGTNTGVYFGFTNNVRDMYSRILYDVDPTNMSMSIVGNAAAVAAGRISYMLDLRGPSMVVDTACSSALVALDTACQAIRAGRCDAALIGGIKLVIAPLVWNGQVTGIGMEAADSLTRTFDQNAEGTAFGEGVEVILIKSLEKAKADGDHIYAVIKGTAVNQDGSSAGITAPNPEAQTECLVRAWEEAGIDPTTLSYIEAHGTATPLGDPIEISSIQAAFRRYTDKKHFCAVGSVKSNIGHLSEGAGLAGLMKCVLALQHQELPGNLYFNRPNSNINLVDSPVYVNARRRKWSAGSMPRRCGVNAFGMSGTNSHVVLEEYGAPTVEAAAAHGPQILTLSARTPEALAQLVASYHEAWAKRDMSSLADLCYTANTGRGHYNCRLALLLDDADELREKIASLAGATLHQMQEKYCFYGEHKIVPEEKEVRSVGELTHEEHRALTATAAAKLEKLLSGVGIDRSLLAEIGALYVRGASVDWKRLYAGQKHHRMSLPVYPFERTQCWVAMPEPPMQPAAEHDGALYYNLAWKEGAVAGPIKERSGTAVLFTGADSRLTEQLAERLRRPGMDVIMVRSGTAYEQVNENLFVVGTAQQDYERLFARIADRNVSLVVHMAALSESAEVPSLQCLAVRLDQGVYSVLHLTRALAGLSTVGELDLCFVAPHVHEVTGREAQLLPEHGALFGLVKTISLENPHMRCRAIDVDDTVTVGDLLAEILAEGKAFAVAYRDGVRYVEEFGAVDLASAPERSAAIRPGGVYLITGGLGGIGAVMARHLAAKAAVRLVLIGRTPLPDRTDWDRIMAAGRDDKLCRRIALVRELEAMGSEVVCCAADVARPAELEPVIAEVHRRFGRIDGVIHGAGVVSPGVLLRKSDETFGAVLAPKVQGTWLLDRLTEADNPDFFILFSSAVTFTGEAGQGDYLAANYYLDTYAAHRNKQGRNTLTIDWVSWADAGMAVEYGINVDTLFKALPSARAVEAFDQLLARDVRRVLVGTFNEVHYDEFVAMAGTLPFALSPRFTARAGKAGSATGGAGIGDAFVPLSTRQKLAHAATRKDVKLIGRDDREYTDVEARVAQMFSDVLGFSDINIYDSFFELGGDSIMLSRMHLQLEKEFPGKIKLVELFEHTSVSRLAQHLVSRMQPKESPPAASAPALDAELTDLIDLMQSGKISIDQAVKNLTKREG